MELSYKVLTAPGDHDAAILAFFRDNDHEFYPPIAARKELTLFVQSVYEETGQYVLCYDGDKIVGLTTILANHPEFLYYYQYVAIDKDYRHKGIASKLYEIVTGICEEQGALRAIVKTWSLNKMSWLLFRKHGFFHGETIEDHRGKGVHSFFYFKSFAQDWFHQPLRCLCVAGSGVGIVNFTRILSALTKDTPNGKGPMPYIVISDAGLSKSKPETIARFIAGIPAMASQMMFADLSLYHKIRENDPPANVELPDMLAIAKKHIDNKQKKWLLAGTGMRWLSEVFNIGNLVIPSYTQQARMDEVITDITAGITTPAYHKEEFAAMAKEGGADGILLGSPELHTMFGFDRQYHKVEIYDPLTELAIIVAQNWTGRK